MKVALKNVTLFGRDALEFEVWIDGKPAGHGNWFPGDDDDASNVGGAGLWIDGEGRGEEDEFDTSSTIDAVAFLAEGVADHFAPGKSHDVETLICDCCGAMDNGNIVDGVCPDCSGA